MKLVGILALFLAAGAARADVVPAPIDRIDVGGGKQLVVSLDGTNPVLALVQGDKTLGSRRGWHDLAGFDGKAADKLQTASCDGWRASVHKENLGAISAARVSLTCENGEDYYGAQEWAILFRLDGEVADLAKLPRLWAGAADRLEVAMDACHALHTVTFKLTGDRLERQITDETTWTDQPIDDSVKSRLKKDCKVGKKTHSEPVK